MSDSMVTNHGRESKHWGLIRCQGSESTARGGEMGVEKARDHGAGRCEPSWHWTRWDLQVENGMILIMRLLKLSNLCTHTFRLALTRQPYAVILALVLA